MSVTLYRKYRPSTFAEVVSQDHIKHVLQSEIINGQLAHAYLFSGPRGLGKTTTARLLAKSVNCENRVKGSAEPCNDCDMCNAIFANQSLDVIEIDAASHRGINEIRALKDHIGFTPAGATYRIFIIDEVHMLTTDAFNALLKTLEEPPEHAMFILATTELHKVPETIKSRCQMFTFNRANREDTVKRLEHIVLQEKVVVEKEVLHRIAQLSGGFLRDAESLLGQVLSLGEKNITKEVAQIILPSSHEEDVREFLTYLSAKDTSSTLTIIHHVVDHGGDIYNFAKEILETIRQLLLTHYGVATDGDMWRELAQKFTPVELTTLAKLLSTVVVEIQRADIPTLPLEIAVVTFVNQEDCIQRDIRNSDTLQESETAIENSVDETNPAEGTLTADRKNVTNKTALVEDSEPIAEQTEVQAPDKTGTLSLEILRERWNDVISAGRKYNHSISLALKMAHPFKMNGNTIELGCAYAFHLERLKEDKSIKLIKTVFQEIFECSVDVSVCSITQEEVEKLSPHKVVDEKEQVQEVSAALDAFGGQVVG